MKKKIIYGIAVVSCFMTVMTGCGKGATDVDMELAQTDVGAIAVPEDRSEERRVGKECL